VGTYRDYFAASMVAFQGHSIVSLVAFQGYSIVSFGIFRSYFDCNWIRLKLGFLQTLAATLRTIFQN